MAKPSVKNIKKYAKAIVEYNEYDPIPDPKCPVCHGTGRYEEESYHNGDFYETNCDCQWAKRDEIFISIFDLELYEMAKAYLEGK